MEQEKENNYIEDEICGYEKNKTRGPTLMSDLIHGRSKGARLEVMYNTKGQPIGSGGNKLASFIGVMARTTIPITYATWKDVPLSLKEIIWSMVQKSFIVDNRSKKDVYSSAGKKWKSFKSTLTTNYVLKYRHNRKLLKKKPEKYEFITQPQWEEFLKSRLTPDFLETHEEHSRIRALHEYDHRMSRKGYANLEEEMKQELGDDAEIDRAILWKKGRVGKDGNYLSDTIRERADKIDALTDDIKEGNISAIGKNDILTQALGTPEQGGHVRGVGAFVTQKVYFSTPKSQSASKTQMLEEQVEVLKAKINMFASLLDPEKLDPSKLNKMRNLFLSNSASENVCSSLDKKSSQLSKDKLTLKQEKQKTQDLRRKAGDAQYPIESSKERKKVCSYERGLVNEDRIGNKDRTELRNMPNEDLETKDDYIYSTPVNSLSKKDGCSLRTKPQFSKENVAPKHDNKKTQEPDPKLGTIQHPIVSGKERKKETKCKLALDTKENIVALGTIIMLDGPLHGVPLGAENIRISIDVAIKEDAYLPIPNIAGDIFTVKNAIGTHVAWPRHLVLVSNEEDITGFQNQYPPKLDKMRNLFPCNSVSKTVGSSLGIKTQIPKEDAMGKPKFPSKQSFTQVGLKMPISVHLLFRFIRTMAENEKISLIIEDGVFGIGQNNFISKNEISQFCLMKQISSICISIYMRHLWSVLQQKNKGHLYAFVDTSHISHTNGKIEARSNALSHRFESSQVDQLFFAPYNTGNRWLLAVIDPFAALVYYFDPLSDINVNAGMKNVIEIGMKIFYAQKGVNSRKKIHWQVIQCPTLAKVVESGYYIMKYMKDIIGTPFNTIMDKFKEKESYTQAEIDEVRVEWAEVVDSYIQANEVE